MTLFTVTMWRSICEFSYCIFSSNSQLGCFSVILWLRFRFPSFSVRSGDLSRVESIHPAPPPWNQCVSNAPVSFVIACIRCLQGVHFLMWKIAPLFLYSFWHLPSCHVISFHLLNTPHLFMLIRRSCALFSAIFQDINFFSFPFARPLTLVWGLDTLRSIFRKDACNQLHVQTDATCYLFQPRIS